METYATKIKKNLGHQPVTQEPNHTNNEFNPKKNPSFKKSFHYHHHHFNPKQNYKAKTFQTTKPTQEEKSSFKNNYNRLNVFIATTTSSNVNSFEINKLENQEKQAISLKKSLSANESETITFKPTWMIKSQSSFVQINKTAPLISDSKENKTKNLIKEELKTNINKLELEESSLISIKINLTIKIENCFVSSEYLLSKTKLIEASRYALAYRVDFMQNYTTYLRLVSLIHKIYWTHRNYSNKKCFNSTALLKKRSAKNQTEPLLGFKLVAKCLISRFDRLSVPKHLFKFSFELVELIYAKTQQFELYINPYSSTQFAKIVLFNQLYLNTDNESTRTVFFSLFDYQCSFDEFNSLIKRTTNESCVPSLKNEPNSLENHDTETESEEPFNLSSSGSDIYEARVDSKRPRPSYIIERDCHVFGGCMDDDAEDEFFISSGAVYQSWPYVYEPGFQMTPLIELTELPLSKSAANLNYFDYNEPNYAGFNEHEDELPSYSLDKFGINFMHTEIKRPKAKKKQRKVAKWNSNDETLYSSSFASYLSTSFSNEEDSGTDEDSSDDSESIIEYKRRHAAGLNCLNTASSYFNRKTTRRCSYLNLSVDEQQSSTQNERFGKNVCSSSENVAKGDSVRFYNRLACSYYDNNNQMNNLKRVRFLSQKRVGYDYDDDDEYCRYERHYMSSNNLVF